ncbi:hypothetical protein [Candidatus Odyssella thessalonicensis]|uniref:hypothetical protein n=1 Tax=Candidatus Odyssella thessalonicensis TaxID=84647 RepID=UPI000225A9CA|nr:hypothetical protein [Candidatus Odyssella thessalonicensis]
MKKILFCVAILTLTINAVPAAEPMEREHESASYLLKMQDFFSTAKEKAVGLFEWPERTTWSTVGKKFAISLTGLVGCNQLMYASTDEDASPWLNYSSSVGYMLSAGLFQDAVCDFIYLIYDHLRQGPLKKKVFGRSQNPSSMQLELYEKLREQDDEQKRRLVRLGNLTFNVLSVASMNYGFYQNLSVMLHHHISLVGLSFPSWYSDCLSGRAVCFPAMTSLFFCAGIGVLIYDLREISFFLDPGFARRGESPWMTIIHGFAKASWSVRMTAAHEIDLRIQHHLQFTDPELYESFMRAHGFSRADRFIQSVLRTQANYQVYQSLLILLKNGTEYFLTSAQVEKLDNSTMPLPSEGRHKGCKRLKHQPHAVSIPAKRGEVRFNLEASAHPEAEPLFVKAKVKSRGKQRVVESLEAPLTSVFVQAEDNQQALIRKAALERIDNLRAQYPIKVQILEKEIRKLNNFLKGHLEGIGGSVFRIVWQVNQKSFALSFEKPHEKDRNNYSGNKLKRVLNTLEVGYLSGLDEDKILAYIQDNKRHNLLRFPKLMHYLISQRN